MKITAPGNHPHPPIANPAAPTISFADLIASPSPESGAMSREEAAGFQALGMFGRYGAVLAPSSASRRPLDAITSTIAPPRTAAASASDAPAPMIEPAARARGGSKVANPLPVQASAPSAGSPFAMPESGMVGRAIPTHLADPAVPEGDPAKPGPAGSAERRSHSNRHRTDVQVRLAPDASGAIASVAATAPALSGLDVERFRSRAEALLREYGLALSAIAVNGEQHRVIDPLRGGPEKWR